MEDLDYSDCEDSGLQKHAKYELSLINALEDWPMYKQFLDVFSSQGHSGGSASIVIPTLNKLLNWQPLSPITSKADEWMDVNEASGVPMWQNKRDGRMFSGNGGKTWRNVDDKCKEKKK